MEVNMANITIKNIPEHTYKVLKQVASSHHRSINSEIITNRKWNINSLQKIIVKVETLITQVDAEIDYLSD